MDMTQDIFWCNIAPAYLLEKLKCHVKVLHFLKKMIEVDLADSEPGNISVMTMGAH